MSLEIIGAVLLGTLLVFVIYSHFRLTKRTSAAGITKVEPNKQKEKGNMSDLQEIAERAEDYYDAYQRVKEFLLENEIFDQKMMIYFLLMGVVWTASKRGDTVTDEDAVIWLGLQEGDITGITGVPSLPGMNEIPLEEFLDYLNKNHF
jgi:hypothetical protein